MATPIPSEEKITQHEEIFLEDLDSTKQTQNIPPIMSEFNANENQTQHTTNHAIEHSKCDRLLQRFCVLFTECLECCLGKNKMNCY